MSKQYEMWLLKQAGESAGDGTAAAQGSLDWETEFTQFLEKSSITRTYKRKRPNYQAIEGVTELCRLCLQKTDDDGPKIFSEVNQYSTLAIKIMVCCGLEISRDENLPNTICLNCHERVENFYAFRQTCESVYRKLKEHVQAVRMKDQNKGQIKEENTDNSYEIENEVNIDSIDAEQSLNSQCLDPETIQASSIVLIFNDSDTEVVGLDLNNEKETHTYSIDEVNTVIPTNDDHQFSRNNVLPEKLDVNINDSIPYNETQQSIGIKSDSDQKIIFDDHTNTVNNPKESVDKKKWTLYEQTKQTVQLINSNTHVVPAINKTENNVQEPDNANITPNKTEWTWERLEQELEISTFITTELIATRSISVSERKLVMPEDMEMMVELVTDDGSTVTFSLEEVDEDKEETTTSVNEDFQVLEQKNKVNDKVENECPDVFIRDYKNLCTVCGKHFSKRSVLKRHWRVHLPTDLRPYLCNTCGRAFSQKAVMKRHELIHEPKRPYACSSCPKSFTQRNNLVTHERSHVPSESRPYTVYSCTKCPKMYLHSSGLSRHMKAHEGRWYQCGQCSRMFQDSSSLRRHFKNCPRCPSDKLDTCQLERNT